MIIGFELHRKEKYFVFKIERYFYGSKSSFRQQVWGLGIIPYRYLAVLKIPRKSEAKSCRTPLVS